MTFYILAASAPASHIIPLSLGEGIAALGGLGVGLLLLLLWLYRRQRLLSTRVRLMREALRNRDFTFRLPTDSRLPGERDLQMALNDMSGEIKQLMARNEVESWQRLTRVLTHEIMNAIAPISSITQAYVASPLVKGTPLEEGMQAINDTTRSLQAFVENYRKLTQLQPANIEPVNLARLIDSIRTLYPDMEWHTPPFTVNHHHTTTPSTSNTTTPSTPPKPPKPPTVNADAGMLHQVAVNIVKNAIEAGAHRIDIRIDNADRHTRLLISNDAPPIAPDVAREIFIPFFTTKTTGSGIGLSLARQMMMAQDGELWLADTPVAGYHTTFVLVFG